MGSSPQRRNQAAILAVARNIRKYRQAKKLTIQDLAFKIDSDYSQVSRMELGKVNFTISAFIDIAEALDVSPADLVADV